MMKTILFFSFLFCSSLQANLSAYIESPYVAASDEGQAHYTVISQKTGSGSNDCALLFISYNGIRMLESSLVEKVDKEILSKPGLIPSSEIHHKAVHFNRWDIPNQKLYLKLHIEFNKNGLPSNFDRELIYDLKKRSISWVK